MGDKRPLFPVCASCGHKPTEARPVGWLRVKVQLTGVDFDEDPAVLKGRTKYFCSRKCFAQWAAKDGFAGLHSLWWKMMTTLGRTRTPVDTEEGRVK